MRLSQLMRFVLFCFAFILATQAHADPAFIQRQEVQAFINKMVEKHGFNKPALTQLFSEVKIRPQVIRHVKKPLENTTWETYQPLFVNEWRIQHGVEFWAKYADVLKKAEETYHVPASIIVATIGVETKYGAQKGNYRVMDALTNIAFSESPRASFFRSELEQFLLLCKDEKLDPLSIYGSYAGAIGQPQFMPSSYRYYAVNFSKSGKTDLMNNEVDVIGSIANYYQKHGWIDDAPVATPAVLTKNINDLLEKNSIHHIYTLDELNEYGIKPKAKAQNNHTQVKLIELERQSGKEYWLGYHNFYVIKRYNASDLYAMAVYQLSFYISALRNKLNNG